MIKQLPLVFISNFLEDIKDTFITLDEETKKELQKQYFYSYQQQQIVSVLSEYPNRQKYCFIQNISSDKDFIKYICNLLNIDDGRVKTIEVKNNTKQCTGSICQYLLKDKEALQKLSDLSEFELLSFCITDDYLRICDFFKDRAKPVQFIKNQDWPRIKRYGTKSGIRQLLQDLNDPQIFLPPGKILYKDKSTQKQIIEQITHKLKTQSLVIKTQKHFSGKGVLIIKREQIEKLNQLQLQNYVKDKMKEQFWWIFDLVLEDFIDLDTSTGPPCVQIYIDKNSKTSVLWMTSMFIADQKQFEGVACGYQTFTQQIASKLIQICETLGNCYSKIGYKGYINLDFLIDKKGTVYLAESNVRRSGSVYIHNFANRMIGKQYFKTHYVINHWLYSKNIKNFLFKNIENKLRKKQLLYTKQKGSGVVLTNATCFMHQIQMLLFFSITKTKSQGMLLKQKISQLVQQNAFTQSE